MFIDSKDYNHIANQFSKELLLLEKKKALIKSQITKKNKYTLTKLKTGNISWRNHETGTVWDIHYGYQKTDGKLDINCTPITSVENDKGRDYLSFFSDTEKRILNKNELIVKIYSAHFIGQYKKRLEQKKLDAYQVINQFFFDKKFGLINDFKQNEKWYMYLNHYGIAMVKVFENYLIFDTFITLKMLGTDQKQAIIDYLKQLKPGLLILQAFYFSKNKEWEKFIKKDDIKNAMKEFLNDSTIPQEEKTKFISDLKNYMDWIMTQ